MRARGNKTSLFLLELLLAILIFSVAAAVCLGLFAQAARKSREAKQLTQAVALAQSAAECYRASGADMKRTAQLLNAQTDDQSLTLTGDLTLTLQRGGEIAVLDAADREIYTLTVSVPGGDVP